MNMKNMIQNEMQGHKETIDKVIETLPQEVETACKIAVDTINGGNKILLCGNGGSAADAQHVAAELIGRYKKERKGLAAIALTTDTSALTAIANDYAYEDIFSRQVEGLAKSGDMIIGISTTGNSANVIRAFEMGRKLGCKTVGLSGKDGGMFTGECDLNIIVPSDTTARIQEMHILIGHMICQAIDDFCG
jgi:D-sedoheptulose 7-phosphate isomerase